MRRSRSQNTGTQHIDRDMKHTSTGVVATHTHTHTQTHTHTHTHTDTHTHTLVNNKHQPAREGRERRLASLAPRLWQGLLALVLRHVQERWKLLLHSEIVVRLVFPQVIRCHHLVTKLTPRPQRVLHLARLPLCLRFPLCRPALAHAHLRHGAMQAHPRVHKRLLRREVRQQHHQVCKHALKLIAEEARAAARVIKGADVPVPECGRERHKLGMLRLGCGTWREREVEREVERERESECVCVCEGRRADTR